MSEYPKPTVPEVLPLVRGYYSKNPVGGNLHVVLDDGNVDDSHVRFCIDQASAAGDTEGLRLGMLLLRMSRTQRKKLSRSKYA